MTPCSRFPLRAPVGVAIAALAVLLCAPALAGRGGQRHVRPRPASVTQAKTVATVPAQRAMVAFPVAGMVIGIDPETGALGMPSPEQMFELTQAERTGLLRTGAGLSEKVLPNGAVKLDLQGQFVEYGVLQLDATGRPTFSCVGDANLLRRLLASPAPAPAPALEER
jgi:hypothetical protein